MPRSAFLILLSLSDRPRHGLAIVDRIEEATRGREKMGPGTLYGTLQKLEQAGLVRQTEKVPDPDDHDTRRRYYRITPKGERELRAETARLRVLVEAAGALRVQGGA
jgi:DNA-binding PadR family transcriptional regulator